MAELRETPPISAWLIYDGDCPFCSAYVKYVRLVDSVGPLKLVNAREGGPLVEEILKRDLNLDSGMVLKLGNQFYHGAECINVLASLSTPSGLFNRFNAMIFRSGSLSKILYPLLRTGRAITLRILGRKKFALDA
ncbi:MAG: DCC1-like thiol-disulfide oxidoreductase family protein [Gammaproteobacteria bacterium]